MIDWERVSQEIGAGDIGSGELAQKAIVAVLGLEEIRGLVDWYVEERPSRELVRCVLLLLNSYEAMLRCYEIYTCDERRRNRVNAIELLRFLGDERAAKWISTFLDDPDPEIQSWGAGLVVRLVRDDIEGPEIEDGMRRLKTGSNPAFALWLENLNFTDSDE